MSPDPLTLRVVKRSPSPLDAALAAFLLDREAARCTPKTLEMYRYALGSFLQWLEPRGVCEVAAVTPSHIRAYLVELQGRQLKDTTQHLHARCLRAWFRWLHREGEIAENPMTRVAMPKLEQRIPAPFTPEEVQALLAACDRQTAVGARDLAMILVLLDTGLRAAELVSLRAGDIDMRTGLATVRGKGQKWRQVRIGARARAALLTYLRHVNVAPGEPLWRAYSYDGLEQGALTVGGLKTRLQRLGRRAGVRPSGPHRFRRTFALWSLRSGMDLHSLRVLMGHSNLEVLQRYLRIAGEDVERAHREHSPVDKLLGGTERR